MKVAFYTTAGPSRHLNQDGLYIDGSPYVDMLEPEIRQLAKLAGFFAVVDGMGGMGGGEVATEIILEGFNKHFSEPALGDCKNLEKGLLGIQKELHARATVYPFMGAAVAGLWIQQDKATVFNCGDCRVYQIQAGRLEKISHDHSIVQELFDEGEISAEEMRHHPLKHILASALSASDADPRIFCQQITLARGERFLICSDGLWECLSLAELEACLAQENAAQALKTSIFAKNARDNVSFIILDLA